MLLMWSHNQGAKWGVSMCGTLSPFDSQPAKNDFLGPNPAKLLTGYPKAEPVELAGPTSAYLI